jgi:hypothetical protein
MVMSCSGGLRGWWCDSEYYCASCRPSTLKWAIDMLKREDTYNTFYHPVTEVRPTDPSQLFLRENGFNGDWHRRSKRPTTSTSSPGRCA